MRIGWLNLIWHFPPTLSAPPVCYSSSLVYWHAARTSDARIRKKSLISPQGFFCFETYYISRICLQPACGLAWPALHLLISSFFERKTNHACLSLHTTNSESKGILIIDLIIDACMMCPQTRSLFCNYTDAHQSSTTNTSLDDRCFMIHRHPEAYI